MCDNPSSDGNKDMIYDSLPATFVALSGNGTSSEWTRSPALFSHSDSSCLRATYLSILFASCVAHELFSGL